MNAGAERPPRLQPLARAKLAGLGEQGRAWHAGLPRMLDELANDWGLVLGRPVAGGSASYVCRATDAATGEQRVLKVVFPADDKSLAREAAVLEAADGHGYVRLHGHDSARRALLLESLGPPLERSVASPEEALDVMATVLLEAWRAMPDLPPPHEPRADTLACLIRRLDARHPGACDPAVLAHALGLAADLAATHDDADLVVCHGDSHPANLLRSMRPAGPRAPGGHVLVDPDGVWAEPASDCGIALREWTDRVERAAHPHALIQGYAAQLAGHTGLEADRIAAWGYLERVSTGLYVLDFGAQRVGRRFLDSALRLLPT